MFPASSHFRGAMVAILCAVVTACASPEPRTVFGRFAGMLPCADCSGIHLELTLRSNPATYSLKQTYEGAPHGNTTYVETGTWSTLRGSAQDPRAIIYELHPQGSNSRQFYLRVNKNTLRLLDGHKQEIPPQLPHTLKRVP